MKRNGLKDSLARAKGRLCLFLLFLSAGVYAQDDKIKTFYPGFLEPVALLVFPRPGVPERLVFYGLAASAHARNADLQAFLLEEFREGKRQRALAALAWPYQRNGFHRFHQT